MATKVFMPKLGATMETGRIIRWAKEEGEAVQAGEILLEIMTDKINIEVEAEVSGVLLKKYYHADEEVPVNELIAYIGEAGEQIEEASADQVKTEEVVTDPAQQKLRATPAARRQAAENGIVLSKVPGTGPKGRIQLADVNKASEQAADKADPVKITPLANKLAKEKGLELQKVTGTGIQGKIMSQDIQRQADAASTERAASSVPLSGMRKVIAQRMAESAFTAPHATLFTEVDMARAKRLREQILPEIEQQTGYRVSYTEIMIKAVSHCLRRHPVINSSLQGDHIVINQDIHIGLAVAVADGLLVPVIHHADQKGLAELTEQCKQLGQLARESKLSPAQVSGGTFTISNLGMYAVDSFTPIINQPESAILGVGRIVEKPVGVNGEIQLRPMMTLSLSIDHRVIDGVPAAAFLTDLKEVLENPLKLLV